MEEATAEEIEKKMTNMWKQIEHAFNQKYQLVKFGCTDAYR